MKYKVVFGILGVMFLFGGILYFAKNKNTDKTTEDSNHDVEKKNTDIVEHKTTTKNETEKDLGSVKADVVQTMKERHEEAQTVMRESLDNIFNAEEVCETRNEEAKKKLFEELDNI
jgi:mevalonate kinase